MLSDHIPCSIQFWSSKIYWCHNKGPTHEYAFVYFCLAPSLNFSVSFLNKYNKQDLG